MTRSDIGKQYSIDCALLGTKVGRQFVPQLRSSGVLNRTCAHWIFMNMLYSHILYKSYYDFDRSENCFLLSELK